MEPKFKKVPITSKGLLQSEELYKVIYPLILFRSYVLSLSKIALSYFHNGDSTSWRLVFIQENQSL